MSRCAGREADGDGDERRGMVDGGHDDLVMVTGADDRLRGASRRRSSAVAGRWRACGSEGAPDARVIPCSSALTQRCDADLDAAEDRRSGSGGNGWTARAIGRADGPSEDRAVDGRSRLPVSDRRRRGGWTGWRRRMARRYEARVTEDVAPPVAFALAVLTQAQDRERAVGQTVVVEVDRRGGGGRGRRPSRLGVPEADEHGRNRVERDRCDPCRSWPPYTRHPQALRDRSTVVNSTASRTRRARLFAASRNGGAGSSCC